MFSVNAPLYSVNKTLNSLIHASLILNNFIVSFFKLAVRIPMYGFFPLNDPCEPVQCFDGTAHFSSPYAVVSDFNQYQICSEALNNIRGWLFKSNRCELQRVYPTKIVTMTWLADRTTLAFFAARSPGETHSVNCS